MNAAVTAPVTTAQQFNTLQFQMRETSFADDCHFSFFNEKKYSILSVFIFRSPFF